MGEKKPIFNNPEITESYITPDNINTPIAPIAIPRTINIIPKVILIFSCILIYLIKY